MGEFLKNWKEICFIRCLQNPEILLLDFLPDKYLLSFSPFIQKYTQTYALYSSQLKAPWLKMVALTSFTFRLTPPYGGNFRQKLQNKGAECYLCGKFVSERRRLSWKGKFGRWDFVIRSCYNSENKRNDDIGVNSDRENKDNTNLATMTSSEKKSDDGSDDSTASISSRVSLNVSLCLL